MKTCHLADGHSLIAMESIGVGGDAENNGFTDHGHSRMTVWNRYRTTLGKYFQNWEPDGTKTNRCNEPSPPTSMTSALEINRQYPQAKFQPECFKCS